MRLHEARFYEKVVVPGRMSPACTRATADEASVETSREKDAGKVRCLLCPHECLIAEGHTGICRSRKNIGGRLYSMVYGRPCALADDPIEKKPLLRFHPGTRCLSLACTGCNLRCKNCQNFDISQASPQDVPNGEYSPESIVDIALQHHLPTIAYTYTEPLTYIEYVHDIARLAHRHHLYNVLVSAGYVNPEPLRWFIPYIDAANIDLKSFSDKIYREWNGATLEPVLEALKIFLAAGVHLEITNLLVPGVNTDPHLILRLCEWLVKNGFADCPLHFSRCFPMFKMEDNGPTPLADLYAARDIAAHAGIKYIYLGNV
ncbi:MAG: AmmeMemoRadiSam system radical SAM enzyme [Prevotella sp.]|nr:AmmeMemoRadiSam system radical SAM enzyme [Prevotella sp.]MCI1685567.1 AmmeMemoRadiSam system radical SAM enzyme [Prevotella sp.]MCI1780904.1 AmmeMemoRadiSam system radical SAM enzyme [Prevotella sp.]MCI1801801.1 AmmeMemoRadiSam system radical SAM enzyme [Prevotella sp.]MCI1816332.1 AmmeMemoRadiSam system radical SAM enzyme [Prevotella sp.]MCI1848963.1 AmmeMemoRadiSam system radical SAM enzyme [Prevotella sp.]